jgi:hypothetical protein
MMSLPDYVIFEYACHEGNYSIRNVLSGARAQENDKDKGHDAARIGR